MVQQEINTLLNKYVLGKLTPSEVIRLKTLMQEMDDASFSKDLKQLWNSYEVAGKRNEEAFSLISGNLQEIIQPRKRLNLLHYSGKIAAAVLVACLFSLSAYLYVDQSRIRTAIAQEYQVIAEKGERASIILPDGTKVYLNAESTLTYPASFTLKDRTVRLTGEAYFEVKHDASAPFIVKTTELEVKVLGTTFNLCANPEEKWFEASLVEGRIEVTSYRNPHKQIYLSPHNKVHYNLQTGEMDVTKTDLLVETAWKRGDLIFRNQPFQEIIERIESFYGVTISTEGICPEELFTGSYHETDITQVLQNLQQHYAFKYRKAGNEISLTFSNQLYKQK